MKEGTYSNLVCSYVDSNPGGSSSIYYIGDVATEISKVKESKTLFVRQQTNTNTHCVYTYSCTVFKLPNLAFAILVKQTKHKSAI